MKTILVVDDDEDLRAALTGLLEDAGHRVLEAGNGADALAVLDENAADLAIVDVMMPGMDGLQLHDAIRGGDRCPALPILLVTASRVSPATLGERKVSIIHKPVTPTALLEAVTKLLSAK